jgi:hypothetical protein
MEKELEQHLAEAVRLKGEPPRPQLRTLVQRHPCSLPRPSSLVPRPWPLLLSSPLFSPIHRAPMPLRS